MLDNTVDLTGQKDMGYKNGNGYQESSSVVTRASEIPEARGLASPVPNREIQLKGGNHPSHCAE